MSVRYRITHDEWINGNKIRYRADILDDEYGGDVIEHIAGGVFFDWQYDKIDERDPFNNPVQKSHFSVELFVQADTEKGLLEDILDADEDRFQIKFYIDDTLTWSGRVLSDLVEYPEKGYPFLVKIIAKDLSSLSGVNYQQFTDPERTRLSVIIANILKNTGLTLPIRAFTNLTHNEVTQADDFLFSIYHQKKAFQNRNKAMNNLEVLENICRAYNLIIRQIGGRWIIEQLTGVAKGDVTQFDYDSDGINPTSSTPDRTITVDGTDSFLLPTSNNKITGAIKSIESTYNHRTDIRNILATSDITPVPFDTLVRSIDIDTEDRFRVAVHFDVEVETSTGGHSDISGQMTISIRSKTEDSVYFLHNDGDFKIGSPPQGDRITITLDGSDNIATGSISLDNQGPTPEGALNVIADITDSPFTGITLEDENENQLLVDRVTLTNVNIYIYNVDSRDYNAAISHIMRRTGDFSVLERVPVTVIGDGPELQSVGIPAKGANEFDDLSEGGFKIRGVTESVKLEELALRERINMRRQAMRNMRADLWMNYSPENLISYDGDMWFFLGGHFEANRSRWSASILALDYNTGVGDTFQRVVESGGAPTGTATEASSTTGDGVTLEQGDERWLNVLENLADLNNIVTARTNLGLGDLAVLDLQDPFEDDNGDLGLKLSDNLQVNAGNLDLADDTTISGTSQADIISPQSGVFKSPVDFRFEQATTTNLRKISIAQATDTQHAVAAGRAVVVNVGNSITRTGSASQNLTGNPTWTLDTVQDIRATASPTFAGGTFTGSVSVSGAVAHPSFSTGFDGSNYRVQSDGEAELKSLLIRENLRAREFIIDQISVVGGMQIISPARGKIATVDEGQDLITIEDPNGRNATTFVDGDLFSVRSIDIDGANIKFVTGTVAGASGTTLQLSPSGVSANLSPGDVIVQRGHPTNTARQSLIYQAAVGTNSPFTRYYSGLNSLAGFTDNDYIIAQVGNLNDLTSTYSAVDGDGLFTARLFATESVLIGDLSKTQGYLSFENDEFDIDAINYRLHAVGMDINSEGTGIPDASVDSTALDGASHDFLSNPESSWRLSVTDIEKGRVLRYWANIYTAVSTAHQPDYRLVVQGRVSGGTWTNIDHTDRVFGVIGDEYGDNQNWNFQVDAFTNYVEFAATNSTSGQHGIYAVVYLYPQGDFTEYRFRVERHHAQSTGTSELPAGSAAQRRVYNRKTTVQQDGFYLVDADIIKREYNALDGDTLISNIDDIILN